MHIYHSCRKTVLRIITIILLIAFLTGCGNSASNGTQNKPSPTSTSDISISGLHIHPDGFSCQVDVNGGPNTLVLATDQLNYDVGTIQQLKDYVDTAFEYKQSNETNPLTVTPPEGFSSVPGAPLGNLDKWNTANQPARGNCQAVLEITNTTDDTVINLSQIDVKLAAVPKLNSYHYRLIDVCSLSTKFLSGTSCPPPGFGGGGQPIEYDFQLKMSAPLTTFNSVTAHPVSLNPHDVADIILSFTSTSNLTYSVIPEITVGTLDEKQTLTLNQLNTTLAFANKDQFSCYRLEGNKFVSLPPGLYDHVWCL